jgi:hypothetical protein
MGPAVVASSVPSGRGAKVGLPLPRYYEGVAAQLVRTFREMAEAFEHASPPTDDDVCITRDGRRLDSPEKVRAFLDELNASVAAERAAAKG